MFARVPALAQATSPVRGRGQQLPVVQRIAFERGTRDQALGDMCRGGCGVNLAQAFPERGEDLVGLPLPGLDLPGFEQQRTIEASGLQAVLFQRVLDGLVPRHRAGLIAAIPEDGARPDLVHHIRDHIRRLSPAQDKLQTAFGETGG